MDFIRTRIFSEQKSPNLVFDAQSKIAGRYVHCTCKQMCDCINPGFKGLVETIQDSSRSHAPAITGLKALKMEVRKRLS